MSTLFLKSGNTLKGETLFEILLSIALLAILATGLFALLSSQLISQGRDENSTMALSLAEEGLLATRAIRDASWTAAASGTHGVLLSGGTWSFSDSEDVTDELYHRTVTVSVVSDTQKQVVSKVTWLAHGNTQQSVQLTSVITDWRNAIPLQVWGDWRYPILGGSVDLGSGNAGMGLTVSHKYVFAAATAADVKKHDFYVVNALDSYHPTIAGSLDTGAGLMDVAVSGTVAYAITTNQSDKLQVINIANHAAPVLVRGITPVGVLAHPKSIVLDRKNIYIGGKYDDLGEFAIFDLDDPLTPTLRGHLKIAADVNSVAVKDNRAYLATSLDNGEILIVDITDQDNPSVIKQVDIPGTGDANDVFFDLRQKRAYVACNAEGAAANPEMAVLNIADIENPTLISALNSNTGFSRVVESGNLAFVASQDANQEFQVFDLRNLAAPVFMSGVNYPQDAMDLALEDNVVYAAVRSNDAIKIITAK